MPSAISSRDLSPRSSSQPPFASWWLAPRLCRLQARHPEFDIHLDMTDVDVDMNEGRVDAAVRYSRGRYRLALAERILEETVIPVRGPAYQAKIGGLPTIETLGRCPLLHEDRMVPDWEQGLAMAGLDTVSNSRGPA